MAADNDNPEAGEAAGRTCCDSFLRRPSVKEIAMNTIAEFMNNAVMARHRPDVTYKFDAAAFFLFNDKAAAILSGKACALLFADGELFWKSSSARQPELGGTPTYEGKPEEAFILPGKDKKKLALFMCSGLLSEEVDIELLTRTLEDAEKPQDWLQEVMPQMAPGESALAAFLPRRRRWLF